MANVAKAARASQGWESSALTALVALAVTYYGVADTSQSAASTGLTGRSQAAIVIWVGIAIFAGLGILPRARWNTGAKVFAAGFAAAIAWSGVSLFWTESIERTLNEVARGTALAGIALAVLLVASSRNWRAVAHGLFIGAATVLLIALTALLAPSILGLAQVRTAFSIDRFSFPLGYWNALGAWTAMTAVLALGYSAASRSPVARGLAAALIPIAVLVWQFTISRAALAGVALGILTLVSLSRSRVTLALHLLVAVPACGLVAALANNNLSMSGGVATGDALPVAVALLTACLTMAGVAALTPRLDSLRPMSRIRPNLRLTLGWAGLLAVLLVVGWTASQYGERALDEFTGATQAPAAQTDGSELSPTRLTYLNGNRHNIWSSAWSGFKANPWTGSGPGTFEFTWTISGRDPEPVLDAHSLYLESLSETGLLGALFLAILIGGILWGGYVALRKGKSADRTLLAALLAMFAVFLVQASLDWMWEATAVSALALAVGATAVGSANSPLRSSEASGLVRASLCAVALVAAFVQLPGLRSTTDLEASRDAVRHGDLAAAGVAADAAVSAAPWSASALGQRGLVSDLRGNLVAAAADFKQAEEKEPLNWRWPLYLSATEARAGNERAARTAYRRARSLKPRAFIFAKESQ